ncbi:MAG: GatB/YqeY domain-containing protein [Bacillota bacterium]
MKARASFPCSVIRMSRAELQNSGIAINAPLNRRKEMVVLSREIKRKRYSMAEHE